ncbi:hypothetical protein [Nocardiopsis potens]|uniref:hypothetical protein n=1 Tax=Nocardiopsis potens TaxID=1246458 RepID=UPI00034549D7|nr:hypothetical protein [Nocardiopsis potens]
MTADAGLPGAYEGMLPADLVLVCGVFGNITDEDVERTVDFCARSCAPGGAVLWTRHRFAPDLVPQICTWFEERGLTREWLSAPESEFGVGVHRLTGHPTERPGPAPGERLFTFLEPA